MASILDSFPRRPLQIRTVGTTQRLNIWAILGLLMFGGALVADVYFFAPDLVDEWRLAGGGVQARTARVGDGGECSTNRGITDCKFDALYVTSDGTRQTRRLYYLTIFEDIDTRIPFTVRYDPQSPQHISTSWGVDLLTNRTTTQLVALLFFGAIAAWLVTEFRWRIRMRKGLEAAGRNPTPIIAHFARVATAKHHADVYFRSDRPQDRRRAQGQDAVSAHRAAVLARP